MAQHDSWQGATGIHVHVNTTCRMVHDDDPAPPGKVTVRDRYMSFYKDWRLRVLDCGFARTGESANARTAADC